MMELELRGDRPEQSAGHGQGVALSEQKYARLSWRVIAISALVTAIAAIAGLAAVAAAHGADSLATTALVLAVLSFSAQLAIAGSQFFLASREKAEANRLNIETRAALVQLEEVSRATAETLRTQFDRVLNHALTETRARATTVEEVRVVERLGEQVRASGIELFRGAATPQREEERRILISQVIAWLQTNAPQTSRTLDYKTGLLEWNAPDGRKVIAAPVTALATEAALKAAALNARERAVGLLSPAETAAGFVVLLIGRAEPRLSNWDALTRDLDVTFLTPAQFDASLPVLA
jgi:hypothetical protein